MTTDELTQLETSLRAGMVLSSEKALELVAELQRIHRRELGYGVTYDDFLRLHTSNEERRLRIESACALSDVERYENGAVQARRHGFGSGARRRAAADFGGGEDMISREKVEALRDAYKRVDSLESDLKWLVKRREEFRSELHAAHARVGQAEEELNAARMLVAQLESAGVEK